MVEHSRQQQQFGVRRRESGEHHADAAMISGELFPQRTQVSHLVPMKLVKIEHQVVLAPGEGITEALSEGFRVRR